MVVNNIAKTLSHMGFSEYEARAYSAALLLKTATAYELARESGIPTSKIYEVITKLCDRKLLYEAGEDKKKKYVPEDYNEFCAREENNFKRNIQQLKSDFSHLQKTEDVSFIYNIHDHNHLIDKSRRLIEKARHSILLSLWHAELSLIAAQLKEAESRGIQIAVVHFGLPEIAIGEIFAHPIEDTLYNEKGGRGFTMVTDSSSAMTGTVFPDSRIEGAWSTNSGFVTLAEDYIKHDIYIMKIVNRFDDLLIKTFGNNYHLLRDIFSDNDNKKAG
ncbi:MAG: TrmB family transcriptional regulator [Spirochaetales bacterium]|nr:TrmB family transcriptional regulator [Spirochaetales bacterium]